MKFEVHHHYHHDYRVMDLLNVINSKLTKIMSKQEQLETALAGINEATNNIAADILSLKAQLEAGTVTQATLDGLTEAAAKLQGIAAETPDATPADQG